MGRSEPIKASIESALARADGGDFDGAIRIYRALLPRVAGSKYEGPVLGLLGSVYIFELGDSQAAIPVLKTAVRLSPRSEISSLGLFHALVQERRSTEAMAEMRRYLRGKPSLEYARLMGDWINEAESPDVTRAGIAEFLESGRPATEIPFLRQLIAALDSRAE